MTNWLIVIAFTIYMIYLDHVAVAKVRGGVIKKLGETFEIKILALSLPGFSFDTPRNLENFKKRKIVYDYKVC